MHCASVVKNCQGNFLVTATIYMVMDRFIFRKGITYRISSINTQSLQI